ncbi:MAG: hypothetical protein M3O31_17005 [Acidobacteriota bacterium]|nr:hypothetical protein [Acidobacteriota bacterium]
MKPILLEQPRFEQPRAVMMLDDAELAFTLVDLAETTNLADAPRTPVTAAKQPEPPALSSDAFSELRSAACLVLDPEEAEALQKVLDQALRSYRPKKAA